MNYEFSIADIKTKEDLQNRIASTLPVPDYYGKNLDAFYDYLTDLPVDIRLCIWIDSTIDLTDPDSIPAFLKGFFSVCEDAQKDNPGLEILFLSEEE